MQFILKKPIEEGLQPVGFNHEQLKSEIASVVETYKGIVVTTDTIKEAKAARAKLNAFRDAIDAERKRVKKAYQKPLREFESKVAELTQLIDEPIRQIDEQLSDIEEAEKQKKTELIKECFARVMGDVARVVGLEQVWNKRWLNKAYKLQDIEAEFEKLANKVIDDINTIRGMGLKHEDAAIDAYLTTLEVGSAIKKSREIEDREKVLCVISQKSQKEPGESEEIDIRIYVTDYQKSELKQFLDSKGIKYCSIPNK